MIYGNESISYYRPSNVVVWMLMAFQAGIINIGGFLACHRFVSHVTGFATFFGDEVSRNRYQDALGMLIVPAFFLFGAMLSGQLVDIRLKLHKKPRYYVAFGFIFLLLFAVFMGGELGMFGRFGEPLGELRDYILLALLCLTCGVQNGTITSVSKAVVRTTHLTGITTDLGVGLVRVLNRHRLPGNWDEEVRANSMRMGVILFFGLGSILGALIFRQFGYGGFILPVLTSGILFLTMLFFQAYRKHGVHLRPSTDGGEKSRVAPS